MKFKDRLTYRNFLDYFGNKLGNKEKHAFEKKIMQDSFESEAYDGLSKLDVADFENDMAELDKLLQKRTKEKKPRMLVWLPYAASLIIVLGLGSMLYYLNQYSMQDELIGAQMEELAPKVEKTIPEPEITKQDSESIDIMDRLVEDLEIEISDADENKEEELMVVSENEEVEDEISPLVKSKQLELIAPVEQVVVASKVSDKNDDLSAENAKRALEGQVAGVLVQEAGKFKSAEKAIPKSVVQDRNVIYGKVVDENEIPIPGVSIVVKGTAKGGVTDLDGQFKLSALDTNRDYKLVASFIGFESKEVNAQADSSLLVILETSQQSMDELVVVGNGIGESKNEHRTTSWEKAKPNQFASISRFEDYLVKELEATKFEHLKGVYKIKFTFVVEAYGVLNNIKFKGNPDTILKKEIERLLLESGNWYPAESGGKAVSSKVRISLKLNLD
ncbi:carboxypeptidase-like regulatory domain-containing protein [Marinifilum sp. RC60d5]|uniref:carboxypeptidase-like regulatory domain-containing protein n=1 Tax=Marinifilum sp. RC60d5 TaxID=3458414 RepID=UPI00403749BD